MLQSNPFCSRCGSPNKQIEAGGKLQCTANEKHRFYPRTDPVVSSPAPVMEVQTVFLVAFCCIDSADEHSAWFNIQSMEPPCRQ